MNTFDLKNNSILIHLEIHKKTKAIQYEYI